MLFSGGSRFPMRESMAAAVPANGVVGSESTTLHSGQGTRTCPLGTHRVIPALSRLRLTVHGGLTFPWDCSHRLSPAWLHWDKQIPNVPVLLVTAER